MITVPCRHNLRRLHLAHLKMAKIPYKTDKGHADWHSLRKTTNTFLRRKMVPLRQRQLFLRHAAADLTTRRYDDERIGDMKDVIKQLNRLWRYVTKQVFTEQPSSNNRSVLPGDNAHLSVETMRLGATSSVC
jgi:hypothetical protein